MRLKGDLREVCENCNDWKAEQCGGCFVGLGNRIQGERATEIPIYWDNNCSTICRAEDMAAGCIEQVGWSAVKSNDTWIYVEEVSDD